MTKDLKIALSLVLSLSAIGCAEKVEIDQSFSGINPYSDYCNDYAGCRYPQFNDGSMRTKGMDWSVSPPVRSWNQQWNASCGTQQMPYFDLLRGIDMWQAEFDDYLHARDEIQAGHGASLAAGWDRLEVKLKALEQLDIIGSGKAQDILKYWGAGDSQMLASKFGYQDDGVTAKLGQEFLADALFQAHNELNQVAKRKVLDDDAIPTGDWVNLPCDGWIVMQNLAKGQGQYGVMCSNLLGEQRLAPNACPLFPIAEANWEIKDKDGNVHAYGSYYSGPDQACGTGSVEFASTTSGSFELTFPGCTETSTGSFLCNVSGSSTGTTSYAVPMTIDGQLFNTWFETTCE